MRFKDIIDGLAEGKHYKCLYWSYGNYLYEDRYKEYLQIMYADNGCNDDYPVSS